MYHQNSSKIQGSTIKLQHGYSIINPSSKIIKFHQIGDFLFQVREDGSVIKHDKNGIILDNHQTISYNINSQNSINISRNSKVLFFNDIVVKENGFIPLIYNTDIKKNGLIQPVPYSQVYIPQRNMYAFLISNYKNHEMHFFSNEGVSITKIQFLEKPIEIIPEIEIVLCEKEDKSCEVYSLDGVHKYSMPSNNARYSFKQHYDYNLNANLFLSAWYHTKSQLYKLSTGEFVKHLWAHPTNMPGYKEKLYSDIHHNFGMSTFKFSPNGDYIVGGADHGKYVAWTTNDLNRYELIPDEPYLQRLGNAEIIEFEGQRILKNRGNEMWKILFFEEGKYFGFQVKKDLLIWDSKFNHIDTILDLGYVNNIIEDQLFVENEDKIEVYKLTL
jgi:WD40 repeat protein